MITLNPNQCLFKASNPNAIEFIWVCLVSDLDNRTIGHFAPRMSPPPFAPPMFIRDFAIILIDVIVGPIKISTLPAICDLKDFFSAALLDNAISRARGPSAVSLGLDLYFLSFDPTTLSTVILRLLFLPKIKKPHWVFYS